MAKKEPDTYSEKEAVKRRDAALFRALNTPPKPHTPLKTAKKKTPPKRG